MQKVAFIIGASSGIGLETSKLLLASDWRVYNGSRTPAPEPGVENFLLDVSDEKTITAAVDKIVTANGKIDALIYSAGFSMAAPVEHAAPADYRYLFEVNFFGAVAAVKAVIPVMRDNDGGRIVLISSMGGVVPIAFDAFYSSSKAALDMFTKEADMELRPYNIRISNVLPGGTCTDFTFKRKVYSREQAGSYTDSMNKAVIALADIEQNGMEPKSVAQTVMSTLTAANPPQLVASGFVNKSLKMANKLLPNRLTQMITRSQYGQ